jgi:homoserine dehydrogenase
MAHQVHQILLLGVGNVGHDFLVQCISRPSLAGVPFSIVGLMDSTGLVPILNAHDLNEAMQIKVEGIGFDRVPSKIPPDCISEWATDRARMGELTIVDATSDDQSLLPFTLALSNGANLVTANKGPVADDAMFSRICSAIGGTGGRIRASSTVGAGLPFIDVVQSLSCAGESIELHATLSGTLAYVLSQLQQARLLSDVVCDARDLGYSEPDPRMDLLGIDVARKARILARAAGWADLKLTHEPFLDGFTREDPFEMFDQALQMNEKLLNERIRSADSAERKLVYGASLSENDLRVGFQEIESSSALAQAGERSAMTISSLVYGEQGMSIAGHGAGSGVTALGLIRDVCALIAGDPGHFLLSR